MLSVSAASPCSMIKADSPDTVKPIVEKKLPIINPLVRLPTWPSKHFYLLLYVNVVLNKTSVLSFSLDDFDYI